MCMSDVGRAPTRATSGIFSRWGFTYFQWTYLPFSSLAIGLPSRAITFSTVVHAPVRANFPATRGAGSRRAPQLKLQMFLVDLTSKSVKRPREREDKISFPPAVDRLLSS